MSASHRTIILALCGLVLLLVGVIAGQNLERSRTAGGTSSQPPQPAPATADGPRSPARPQAALSATEYWISAPELDATRTGFSAWAVLRPGGNFILERCHAPDYAMPAPGAPLEEPVAQCESIVDGLLSELGENRLVVRAGDGRQRTFRFSLARKGTTESLVLDVGTGVALVPGTKNSLFQRLQNLPADEDARNRYLRQMFTARIANAPGAASKPTPGRAP